MMMDLKISLAKKLYLNLPYIYTDVKHCIFANDVIQGDPKVPVRQDNLNSSSVYMKQKY